MKFFGKFLEIVEGFNLVLVALGKGSCRVWDLWGNFWRVQSIFGYSWKRENAFFFGRQPLKKGVWRFEIALVFQDFFRRQALEKGIRRFEIALRFFSFFWGGKPLKRESGDLRLLWDYLFHFFEEASLEKGSLEIWDCFGIIFWKKIGDKPWKRQSADLRLLWDHLSKTFRRQALKKSLEIWDFFWWEAFGKGSFSFINDFFLEEKSDEQPRFHQISSDFSD